MKGFFKIGGIYFDTKPTKGSNNVVTSDGILKAIKEGSISYDDTELRNRITQAENDIDSLEISVSEKATTASVTALSDRVTQAESDIDSLETSVSEINDIIKPSGTVTTIHRNYTNVPVENIFDESGVITKTPTELITALKNKGFLVATSGFTQIHCCINFVNSNTNRVTISDGTHNINLVNGWIEFEGCYLSNTSTYNIEERWVMKLFDVSNCGMSLITKRANSEPTMKMVTLQ